MKSINVNELQLQIESMSGGKNTVVLDDHNEPSIMVRIPKFKCSEVIEGGRDATHPAFIIDNVEVECLYISKYQNVVINDRAYSLPFKDPAVLYTYDECAGFCANKGERWHLMTNAEWAAIALWCKKNNTLPHGNNSWGKDYQNPHEHGVVVTGGFETPKGESEPPVRVATGSGPAGWSHDGTEAGIYDLNGNVWEYVAGLRLTENEINIVENNNAARITNLNTDSNEWRSIGAEGRLDVPGTLNTLRFTYPADNKKLAVITDAPLPNILCEEHFVGKFNQIHTNADDQCTALLKELALIPDNYEGQDGIYAKRDTELLPIRGGYWANESNAGLFACLFYMGRTDRYFDIGFRCCYYDQK